MSKEKDKDSWKGRSIARRDFRHAHDEPEVPRHKGKKRREEILEVREQYNTFGFELGIHGSINDLMDAGGPNEIYCSCGKQLFPDSDMSRISINQCFNDHRRDVIDNLVEAWHNDTETTDTIWEYLGWTQEDYKDWVEGAVK